MPNPFTLGHQYLVEKAAAACDTLHLFVVSEDASLVPFAVRKRLVEAGVAHLPNVVLHDSGPYIISNATFPSYFLKDEAAVIDGHARLDLAVFTKIAKALNITARYVGEEPTSQVTGLYNKIMCEQLPKAGIECIVVPRKEADGKAISASTVRQCLQSGDWETLKTLLPQTSLDYFRSPEAGRCWPASAARAMSSITEKKFSPLYRIEPSKKQTRKCVCFFDGSVCGLGGRLDHLPDGFKALADLGQRGDVAVVHPGGRGRENSLSGGNSAGELDVDVVLRDGQQDVDRGGVREETVHREAQHEGRAIGCGGKLIITVAVPCAGGGSLFQPFEREGEAGKLLQLDGVGLDAQHSGGLRLGDVVAQTPIRQQNACDGELICDRLAQDGVELAGRRRGSLLRRCTPG